MKRSSLYTALVSAVIGLTLASCSPPHQVDSHKRVDTATSVTAGQGGASRAVSAASTNKTSNAHPAPATGSAPTYIDCTGAPVTQPNYIALACGDNNDRLVNITWSRWDATEAVGTATRETNTCLPNCADGHIESVNNVEVKMGVPTETDQGITFTQLTVNNEVIAQ